MPGYLCSLSLLIIYDRKTPIHIFKKWPWGETEFSIHQLKCLLKHRRFAVISTWKNPSLDRYLNVLFNFHQTRYGEIMPRKLLATYQALTKPFRWLVLKCFPTSIVIIGYKEK